MPLCLNLIYELLIKEWGIKVMRLRRSRQAFSVNYGGLCPPPPYGGNNENEFRIKRGGLEIKSAFYKSLSLRMGKSS